MSLMYIDPGMGGMLLQIIIGLAAVAGAVIFSMRRTIKGWFNKDAQAAKTAQRPDVSDELIDPLEDSEV